LDDHWKNIGNEHTLRFSNLPSGYYTLKIKAANSDGEWNDEPLVLSFTATPPFYKTWWFILLSIVAIAVAVYLLYHYRLQQAIKLERIRTRIATDLHDDIGATLSSISMYSDAVKNQVKDKLPHLELVLEKMGENSRSMVSSMSDIVWAINPGNDEGEQLVQRMESYARDICAVKNVPLTFSSGDRINHINLSLELKKNIYLIFKESLNNALKYAGAKHILVSIELTGNTIRLKIKDDGKGFDPKEVRKGNGLKNIHARAQEIGAALLLTSEPGKGTSVELNCVI
jgi:signal transduction histidine kinase